MFSGALFAVLFAVETVALPDFKQAEIQRFEVVSKPTEATLPPYVPKGAARKPARPRPLEDGWVVPTELPPLPPLPTPTKGPDDRLTRLEGNVKALAKSLADVQLRLDEQARSAGNQAPDREQAAARAQQRATAAAAIDEVMRRAALADDNYAWLQRQIDLLTNQTAVEFDKLRREMGEQHDARTTVATLATPENVTYQVDSPAGVSAVIKLLPPDERLVDASTARTTTPTMVEGSGDVLPAHWVRAEAEQDAKIERALQTAQRALEAARDAQEKAGEKPHLHANIALAAQLTSTARHHFNQLQRLAQKVNVLGAELADTKSSLSGLSTDYYNSSMHLNRASERDVAQDEHIAQMNAKIGLLERATENAVKQLDNQRAHMGSLATEKQLHELSKKVQDGANTIRAVSEKVTVTDESLQQVNATVHLMADVLPIDCADAHTLHATGQPRGAQARLRLKSELRPEETSSRSYYTLIKPINSTRPAAAQCIEHQGGWRTVVQTRRRGEVSFNRTYADYVSGFGAPATGGDYWLGLEHLHAMTTAAEHTLLVQTWDVFDNYRFVQFNNFSVAGAGDYYRLHLGSQASGNLTADSLRKHDGMAFSAYDRDNDASHTHCARFYAGGWWYSHCHTANLNGNFYVGMIWFDERAGDWLQLKRTVMSIARR